MPALPGLHQAEFFHSPAQGRDGQVEYFGGAASAADHALRVAQDFLDVCSRRIVNEVKGISRVVYDISGKPPATIEWE